MPTPPTVLMLQDLSSNKLGGTEEYTLAFGRALKARGGQLVVAVRAMESTWRDALLAQGAGVEIIPPGIGRRQFDLALARIVRRVRPAVTIMNFFSPVHAVPVILWAAGARRIIFVDDISGGINFRSPVRRLGARFVAARCMAPVDRIIGVSEFVTRRDQARFGLPARKMHTVYNGVHTRAPEPAAVAALRRELGVGDGPVVLGLGHFIEPKGFHLLVEAFARCLPAHPDATLVLVGAQPTGVSAYADSIRAQVDRLPPDRVRLLGVRSDARTFMAASDVVAVPSTWEEAFGFVVAEGMMVGAAVLASRTGGIPELIADGQDGLLVAPGSVDDLAEKLAILLADPALRARIGAAAARRAHAQFSLDAMVDGMMRHVVELSRGRLRPR